MSMSMDMSIDMDRGQVSIDKDMAWVKFDPLEYLAALGGG